MSSMTCGWVMHQQVVVALQRHRPVCKALAAEILFGQLEPLDHRAHGAVEHQDALFGWPLPAL